MVQFKQAFEGVLKPPAATCVSHQKCVRAGGKHNDLDNVVCFNVSLLAWKQLCGLCF
jgi:alanyl-tRNA synthetase